MHRLKDAGDRQNHVEMPDLEPAKAEEKRYGERAEARIGIGQDHGPATIPPVDQRPVERGHRDLRELRRQQNSRQLGGAPRLLIDIDGKSETGEIGADRRDELPAPDHKEGAHDTKVEIFRPSVKWGAATSEVAWYPGRRY